MNSSNLANYLKEDIANISMKSHMNSRVVGENLTKLKNLRNKKGDLNLYKHTYKTKGLKLNQTVWDKCNKQTNSFQFNGKKGNEQKSITSFLFQMQCIKVFTIFDDFW